MIADGVPDKLVNLIKSYYSSTKARIRIYDEESHEFNLNSGVWQGCSLPPVLLNMAIDWIKRQACDDYRGVQISPRSWMTDMEFVDDIAVLANDLVNLQFILDRIVQFAYAIGLEINASKTKIFYASSANSD